MATTNPYSNYVFFNPFPDAGVMVSQAYLNGKNEFDIYIEQNRKKVADAGRTNGKSYSIRHHNPNAGGGLKTFGADLCLYICAHGQLEGTNLVGQIDYQAEPPSRVGTSQIKYDFIKSRRGYRYSLMGGELEEVLQWEGLHADVAEIRFWACQSASATYARLFSLAGEDLVP